MYMDIQLKRIGLWWLCTVSTWLSWNTSQNPCMGLSYIHKGEHFVAFERWKESSSHYFLKVVVVRCGKRQRWRCEWVGQSCWWGALLLALPHSSSSSPSWLLALLANGDPGLSLAGLCHPTLVGRQACFPRNPGHCWLSTSAVLRRSA